MFIELITNNHPLYRSACKTVRTCYQNQLGVNPVSYPKVMLVIVAGDEVVGVSSINLLGKERCQTEKYCAEHLSELATAIRATGGTARDQIVEVGTFGVLTEYQATCAKTLAAETLLLLSNLGKRTLLITQGRHVRICLRQIGVQTQTICAADLKHYHAPEKEKNCWRERYWRTKPEAAVINIQAATIAASSFLAAEMPNDFGEQWQSAGGANCPLNRLAG